MPKPRLQRQETIQDENQISPSRQNKRSRSDRWWIVGILTVAIIVGGVIGFFSLSGNLGEGAHFFTAFIGIVVFLFLGGMLIAGIKSVRDKHQSLPLLFLWSVFVITSAIVGFLILPSTLLVPIRIFLGACIGYIGLYLLIAVITNPKAFFGELLSVSVFDIMAGFIEEGCCLGFLSLFIAIIGTISSLLIWHSLLLSVFAGGGSALVVLIAFVSLAFAKPSGGNGIQHGVASFYFHKKSDK